MIRKVLTDPWLHAAVLAMTLDLALMSEEFRRDVAEITAMTAVVCDHVPTVSSVAKIINANKAATATEVAFAMCARLGQ
jgi:hypothetical protein